MIELIIGSIGAFLILLAFILNQVHKWKDTDLKYDVVNTLGSFLLVVFAWMTRSWPFLVLNTVWLLVSARDVFIDLRKK